MVARVANVAVLDDTEPILLVQRYYLPGRIYQVMRKQTSPDEHFSVSDGVEIDPDLWWSEAIVVNDDMPEDRLAAVLLDEENQPAYNVADLGVAQPYAFITYDLDARLYHCVPVFTPRHGSLASIRSRNMDEAITSTVVKLDRLLKKHWWNLEPWLSASWGKRLLLFLSAFFWVSILSFPSNERVRWLIRSILFLSLAIVLIIFLHAVDPHPMLDEHPTYYGG